MAPTSSDPKDLKLILNPARRRALTVLIGAIIEHMRNQLSYSFDTSNQNDVPSPFIDKNSDPYASRSPVGTPQSERERRLEARLENNPSSLKLKKLERAAQKYFDDWQDSVIAHLGKTINGPEDPRSDQRRKELLAARPPPPYVRDPDNKDSEQNAIAEVAELAYTKEISALQALYHPIPTRLTTIPREDRISVLSAILLLLLSLGHYSAHSRVLLCYLTSSFELPLSVLSNEESEVARTLLLASKALTADAETKKRQEQSKTSRRWKVGLASVAGAAVIGITGGLAAPVVAGAIGGLMGGVGLGGLASFLGIFAMNGALVGSLFGAYGAKMTGTMVDNYAKEVSDFKFLPLKGEWGPHTTRDEEELENRRLRVTIGINGWLTSKEDVLKPWRSLGDSTEVFALRYEMEALLELGNSLQNMVSSYAWSYIKIEILKRTVLATLWSALWPIYLVKMATSIDNPFAVAKSRSEKAGQVLADAIINKAQGERPVTLIGYSLGARVIYSCLNSLAERKAFGLVENVILIGAPIPSTSSNWKILRSVVSGKIVNVYSENDYILAFLYRATSMQYGVGGLQKIDGVIGVENLNLSNEVSGHLRYPNLIGKILRRVGGQDIKGEEGDIEKEREISLVDGEEEGLKVNGDGHFVREVEGEDLMEFLDDPEPLPDKTAAATTHIQKQPSPKAPAPVKPTPRDSPPREPARNSTPRKALEWNQPTSREPTTEDITSKIAQVGLRNTKDSDSDYDGGIQMLDDDSDVDLETYDPESMIIPEGDHLPVSSSRKEDEVKAIATREQKSLAADMKKKASDFGLY